MWTILLITSFGFTETSVFSANEFKTKAKCEAAAEKWVVKYPDNYYAVCVFRGKGKKQ